MPDIERLLGKITTDVVIDAMVDHKWLVGWTIARHIVTPDVWGGLSDGAQGLLIRKVNTIKLETPGLM